jgi:acyl transferase domain-containing protein
VEFK